MFYRIDENNEIIDYANFKYSDECIETHQNIMRKINGKLVFENQSDLQEKANFEKRKEINLQIDALKQQLASTDYQAIKYGEGELTEEAYAPIKAQRKAWRDEINRLEAENNGL